MSNTNKDTKASKSVVAPKASTEGLATFPKAAKAFLKPQVKNDSAKPIQVVAIDKGYYNFQRLEIGMKFTIKSEADFSEKWMQKI